MKFKKILIILATVLFFVTALTFYLNRVIFPQLLKKIAIERIEEAIKRKVEIGSIHFNWVRGFIIDKVKIYEKGSERTVFAQADQVSFGVLFFPGLKHYKITIPFINVRTPSVHLIRIAEDIWNFSDMYTPPSATAPLATSAKTTEPSALQIAWGGITVNDGKFLIDDNAAAKPWSEYLDNINLKLSLSYKGISYDFTADIPGKKGLLGATVYYQPITQNTQAHIRLKNIDTTSYLSLINIPDMRWDRGIIKDIDLNINYTQNKTSVQGDILMQDLDITSRDQNFKGDIEIHSLNAQYQDGNIIAQGQMALSNVTTTVPGLSAGGSVQARVNNFEFTKEKAFFDGSIHAQHLFVNLKDRQVKVDDVNLNDIKIKKDNNGVQSTGNVTTQGLFVQWADQKLQGDITLKNARMRMKDENDISLESEVQADNFSTDFNDKSFNSKHILLQDAQLTLTDQKNIALITSLSMDEMTLHLGENLSILGSVKTDKLLFRLDDGILKTSATLNFAPGKFILDHHKTIEAHPQVELTLQMPLDDPKQLTYKGSVTLSDGTIRGFSPIESLDNVELDADFQNDEATINALSINVLDTNVRVNGTVKNFTHPILNILAEADDLNLSKIKDISPKLVEQYGLTFDGSSFVKVKFEGLASDPLSGKISATASVKNVSIASSKLHQNLKNITGIIEATPDSLQWRDFTAVYLGKKYALGGTLENFKNPQITTTINGPDLELKADLVKNEDLVTLNSLKGKYLNATFESEGHIRLLPQGPRFDISSSVSLLLEDLIKDLPPDLRKNIAALNPTGTVTMDADLKGTSYDWKNYIMHATVTCPDVNIHGYHLTDMKIDIQQGDGKVKNLTFDGKLYDGTVHAVGSMDLLTPSMPYDLALNIDNTDMHQLKMDSPLKMDEIDGKFFLTTVAHGTVADFKNSLHATGSLAIRDGFLAEFNLFKGLLGVLNDALRLGQVEITDVESNFVIENQKISTDNLRLKGPTIVLLGKGWINFDAICDLNMTVDLSSGVVPAIAHDVLNTLNIHIYDNISDPKFKKKISVPQVINTLLKNLLQ